MIDFYTGNGILILNINTHHIHFMLPGTVFPVTIFFTQPQQKKEGASTNDKAKNINY